MAPAEGIRFGFRLLPDHEAVLQPGSGRVLRLVLPGAAGGLHESDSGRPGASRWKPAGWALPSMSGSSRCWPSRPLITDCSRQSWPTESRGRRAWRPGACAPERARCHHQQGSTRPGDPCRAPGVRLQRSEVVGGAPSGASSRGMAGGASSIWPPSMVVQDGAQLAGDLRAFRRICVRSMN